jgi:hypothetical protein
VNDDRPPVHDSWWEDWGKSVAYVALGILAFVAAMALAVWLVSLLL